MVIPRLHSSEARAVIGEEYEYAHATRVSKATAAKPARIRPKYLFIKPVPPVELAKYFSTIFGSSLR
jgi:hypothetical protein